MFHEEDIAGPREVLRILRAADQELVLWQPAGGLDEQRLEDVLPVLSVGAEIRDIAGVSVHGCGGFVDIGVDAAIKRSHYARAETALELIECAAAGVAQDQVEVLK